MRKLFHFSDTFAGFQSTEISVPETSDKFISCCHKELFFIPPRDKIIAIRAFLCYGNFLFSLDCCPLINGFIMHSKFA